MVATLPSGQLQPAPRRDRQARSSPAATANPAMPIKTALRFLLVALLTLPAHRVPQPVSQVYKRAPPATTPTPVIIPSLTLRYVALLLFPPS